MRIALKFAYDGKAFYGYARQPELKTVEGEIIKSLVKHSIIEDTKEAMFRSASRTDKGVSALGNVIAFNTDAPKKRILEGLSDTIPNIVFYGVAEVEPNFYPRHANQRIYRYHLKKLHSDIDQIISVLSLFTGEHDFTNFARIEDFKDPIRSIDNIIITENDDFLIIDFHAQTFLWHQIRRIISALMKIGTGKLEKEQVIEALENPNKKVDFGLAPAEPLILKDIIYDFDFEIDKKLQRDLALFEKRINPKGN